MSTGLTLCYSSRLFYFVLCGDFNFVPSYSAVEVSYIIVNGIIGSLVISVYGCGSLMWLICTSFSIICLPYYLKYLLYIHKIFKVFSIYIYIYTG